MARLKDERKRAVILNSSKRLFSEKGFFNTSVSDIVEDSGLPVGTIYTYFENKEEIVRVIVEEGWANLESRLEEAFSYAPNNEEKVKILINQFLPELFNDLDLINILLAEAISYTRIEEKIEKLSDLIFSAIKPLARDSQVFEDFDRNTMYAALMVYFLGIMNAVKVAKTSSLPIKIDDIMNFIKTTIANSMDISF
jgi:AcrR family transcriptional regulator